MITRRDWWLGIALISASLLAHAVWPRYVWRQTTSSVFVREDRWRGTLERGSWDASGRWVAVRDQLAQPTRVLKFEPLEESTSATPPPK
jgi:hypothetical protein